MRKHRNCGTEQLEVRQLLTGAFDYAAGFGGTNFEQGNAIATDVEGNVYVTGQFNGTVDFDPGEGVWNLTSAGNLDIFVSKLDSAGNLVWARSMGGTSFDEGYDIAVDSAGNVYTTGYSYDTADFDPGFGIADLISAGGSDVFVSKLDSSGNFVGARRMGGASFDVANGIAVDNAGNICTTGYFYGTADFEPGSGTTNLTSAGNDDVFVSKLDRNGNFVWARTMGGNGGDRATDIAIDGSGNVYTTGYFYNTADFDPGSGTMNLTSAGVNDIFVSKLDTAGNSTWARRMGGAINDYANGIAIDDFGNVYTTGLFYSAAADFDPGNGMANLTSAGAYDIFVSKLDSSGNFVWAKSMGGIDGELAIGIAVDDWGNVYTTGYFYGSADFDPGHGTAYRSTAGPSDVFISKLDNVGSFVWAKSLGGTESDSGRGIAIDGVGNVYTTGYFRGTADFDPGSSATDLISAGDGDIFVSRLSPDMEYTLPESWTGELLLRRNGAMLELWFNGTYTNGQYNLLESDQIETIRQVRIYGNYANNNLTVDFAAGGPFLIDQGIIYSAGSSTTNSMQLIGLGNEGFTYQPSSTAAGSGTFLTYGNGLWFSGVEFAGVSNAQALIVEPLGSADVLTVTAASINGYTTGSRITGTTDSKTIVPLTFQNVRDLTIDTGMCDGLLAQSSDTVTFNAGSYEAQGLRNVFVRTGKGNDTLAVNGPNIGLPIVDGRFWFLGGANEDRLTAIGDTNWDLNDTRLVSAGGGRILHDDIEKASLTGGAGKNHLNASLFSGDVTLDGVANNDLLRGGSGNDILYGGSGVDRLFGGHGDDLLYGQDGNDQLFGEAGEDTLWGSTGNDQLWGGDDNDWASGDAGADLLQGGSGEDTLNGGDNNDQLFGDTGNDVLNGGNHDDSLFGGDGNDTINGDAGNDVLSGGSGNDALAGGTGIDLYDLQGTGNAEHLQLLRASATSSSFRRRPRGLVSVLELDTITMDTTDEFLISALGGDDLIAIDLTFTQLGSVDGGDGTDSCTAPVAWTKVSC